MTGSQDGAWVPQKTQWLFSGCPSLNLLPGVSDPGTSMGSQGVLRDHQDRSNRVLPEWGRRLQPQLQRPVHPGQALRNGSFINPSFQEGQTGGDRRKAPEGTAKLKLQQHS